MYTTHHVETGQKGSMNNYVQGCFALLVENLVPLKISSTVGTYDARQDFIDRNQKFRSTHNFVLK